MGELTDYAKRYYRALKDLASALPSDVVPGYIKDTSFVIACSDMTERTAIRLIGRGNQDKIVLDGKTILPVSANEPNFLVFEDLPNMESFLFTQDDKRTSIAINIGDPNVVLDGLAFSSKEYNDKYWADAKFYRNCSGSIPFSVTATGSMLGLDLLWGAEFKGQRREVLFEFIKIYGSRDMLPSGSRELQDAAFRDFGHAALKIRKELRDWSFTDFLNELREPVERNVLLLGAYGKCEGDFTQLKAALKELGYNGFVLKDSRDLPIQSNIEKLISAVICSCFVIVVDKEASGHIAEINEIQKLRFRPVIVLRESDKPTTAFLEDRIRTDEYFQVAVINDISPASLLTHIKWARGVISKQISSFNSINYWRN